MRRRGVVVRQMTLPVRGSVGLSCRAFDASAGCLVFALCSHAGSCHSSCAQHFVCVPAPVLHIRPALWRWVSARIRRRTTAPTPPPGAQSRPFHSLTEPLQTRQRGRKRTRLMANGNTNLVSTHARAHCRCPGRHVTVNKMIFYHFSCVKDGGCVRTSPRLHGQPCTRWRM